MVDSALHGWCVRLRNAGRGGIVERGLLSTSDQEWAEARRRSAVIGPLAAMGGVGHQAADAAAEQLGLSRRQVYVLVSISVRHSTSAPENGASSRLVRGALAYMVDP